VDLTTGIAIYGGVLSTLVGAWNIYRAITDSGCLRVDVYTSVQAVPGVGVIAHDRLAFKVTNAGRQPIWLKQIGGSYGDKEFLITTGKQLPCKLEPGEDFLEAAASATDILEGPREPIFLGAWDTLGKVYKLPRRRLKALLRGRGRAGR
jgi:hypothetical protein